jgi:hypothetical protein
MSTTIVDRRNERPSGRYVSDVDRFKRRHREEIRDYIRKKVNDGSIKNFGSEGVDVPIPKKGTRQPTMHHGQGGRNTNVLPGNKEFEQGDRFKKPPGGGGGRGNDASIDGEGEDDFIYVSIPVEEVLSILFEGAELPNMTKIGGKTMTRPESRPDGYATKGPHSRMDLARTFANKKGEEFALNRVSEKNLLKALKAQLEILKPHLEEPAPVLDGLKPKDQALSLAAFIERVRPVTEPKLDAEGARLMKVYDDKIRTLKKLAAQGGGWREEHMDFRREKDHPTPITQAVMFCLMDVSASMDEERKEIAKSFFGLLNKFLKTKYEKVDVVFIRHTQTADEVDEETFFYDQQTGGTVVSTSLEKMKEIMEERYSDGTWNIYGAQASDGGNYSSDNAVCIDLLDELIPAIQSFFYVEVAEDYGANLWDAYKEVKARHPEDFFMARAKSPSDIIPVFKALFSKNNKTQTVRMEPPLWARDLG